jgi:4-hydroxythreonine-4-phosphate dehydrogenase
MKPIGITMGDAAGIGPEIIARLFAQGLPDPAIVIGDLGAMRRGVAVAGMPLDVVPIPHPDAWRGRAGTIEVVETSRLPEDLPFGKVDARAGRAAYDAIIRAIDLAREGAIRAIVTAPINKEALKAARIPYPGHTEILADRSGTNDFAMMLANQELRVLLVSVHVPLSEAVNLVTPENEARAIRLAHEACLRYGIPRPRVAVAGLNPHAGEGGLFGGEDMDVIAPAVEEARAQGIDASGPWPPDTVFMRARRGEFDIVVAQYHDQGLIPVKYLGLDEGVNVTVGLPFVRTSVDHGTAFDIAGKGLADPRSLRVALEQAASFTPSERPAPDFVFMLTRHDATVDGALAMLPAILGSGIRHIGFKDVGQPFAVLQELAAAIKAAGARCYLEVVSLDEASEVRSAQAALALGVDVLMGGTRPEAVLPVIAGSGIRYYPFPGLVTGHPSVLEGPEAAIVESARRLAALDGVDGLDLLAYRFEGDVPRLIKQVCLAAGKPVIVAGSIDGAERIASVVEAGAAGFTIGTAAFQDVFDPVNPGLAHQLAAIRRMLAGLTV